MKREDYIKSEVVIDFIQWISKRLDEKNSFVHEYYSRKARTKWKCDSLFSAYNNYGWPFSLFDEEKNKRVGFTFEESDAELSRISSKLRDGLNNNNYLECQLACNQVLQWGGVTNKNSDVIKNLGEDLTSYLKYVNQKFTSDLAYNEYYDKNIYMNSGFTKIYSLLLDDFVIYDSRVGAALGLLVRKYCEDKELRQVPKELCFAWGAARTGSGKSQENMRNPSSERYKFSQLANRASLHTENNIRANWIIKEILDKTDSKFSMLEDKKQMRALESALFMIGYSVNE